MSMSWFVSLCLVASPTLGVAAASGSGLLDVKSESSKSSDLNVDDLLRTCGPRCLYV